MDQRPDRKVRTENRAKRIGLNNLQRFTAVNVWNDPRVNMLKNGRARHMTKGEIGCLLSHYDLWCLSADTGFNIYIQEDDIIYQKNFISIANNLIEHMDKLCGEDNWHIVHLSPYITRKINPDEYGKPILINEIVWTNGAYVISSKAATLLIEMLKLPTPGQERDDYPNVPVLTADHAFIRLFLSHPNKSVTTYPYPSFQDKSSTDTQRNRHSLNNDRNFYQNIYAARFNNLYDLDNECFKPEEPVDELNN